MILPGIGQATAARLFESPNYAGRSLTVQTLNAGHEREVFAFLAVRPVHTVFMAGFIRDNGLVSDLNRGTFYACRDARGRLEGVALIGHFTLVEARSEGALAAFARLAQGFPSAHLILGEQDKVRSFWNYFKQAGRTPRRVCRELLFEQHSPIEQLEPLPGLRQANPQDLEVILPINAEMILQESGVDPLEADPEGFRQRWLRRIEQGRVWVWVENGRLIFSASCMSEGSDVIYLEGIYVRPDERGKGYGARCLSQLSRQLLLRAKSLCLLVNQENRDARAFYEKSGYRLHGHYDTIFLHLKN